MICSLRVNVSGTVINKNYIREWSGFPHNVQIYFVAATVGRSSVQLMTSNTNAKNHRADIISNAMFIDMKCNETPLKIIATSIPNAPKYGICGINVLMSDSPFVRIALVHCLTAYNLHLLSELLCFTITVLSTVHPSHFQTQLLLCNHISTPFHWYMLFEVCLCQP